MARSGEKADLAAPGESKEGTFCARCFAPVAPGEAFCPDCGAPTGEAPAGTDSAVHGELAQANLLRLRGNLDGSEKALLGVLRRYPNDPLAHEMLGDVCAERGEDDRAVEWYELALDLAPNSPEISRKLQETKDHLAARTTADAAEVLGLPTPTPVATWWPLALAGGLLALAIIVAAWPRNVPPAPLRGTVSAPDTSVATTLPEPPAPQPTVEPPPIATTGVEGDRELLAMIQKGAEGSRIQNVVLDPRTNALDVTFEVSETDDAKALALLIGRSALAAAPAALTTTLRAVHAGKLVFAADLARAGMDGTDPLTNVWPAPTEVPSTNATTGTTSETTPTPTPVGGTTGP